MDADRDSHGSVVAVNDKNMTITGYQNIRRCIYLAWSYYVSVPKIIRFPITSIVLLFASVIIANIVFGVSDGAKEVNFHLEPGGSNLMKIEVDPGQEVNVLWSPSKQFYISDQHVSDGLLMQLRGPSDGLSLEARGIRGRFHFWSSFPRGIHYLRLSNENVEDDLHIDVKWTFR